MSEINKTECRADKYLIETLKHLQMSLNKDENPRPKWSDDSDAYSTFITQKSYRYNILNREYPINTLRTTALKGAWYDIEAIYIKQTNIIEDMHPSIHAWWKDFSRKTVCFGKKLTYNIGQTYGHTVKRYNLMNKLLEGMEKNPFSRRHIINLWQEQQMQEDPQALVPCCYETLWSIRDYKCEIIDDVGYHIPDKKERLVDLTLNQRSIDYLVTASINPAQYVMFGMAVCNHLTFKTGIKHQLGDFIHNVQNVHCYDRHIWALQELLDREPTGLQPKIELVCEPKDFYDHKWEDFKITGLEGIKPLSQKLEIAV